MERDAIAPLQRIAEDSIVEAYYGRNRTASAAQGATDSIPCPYAKREAPTNQVGFRFPIQESIFELRVSGLAHLMMTTTSDPQDWRTERHCVMVESLTGGRVRPTPREGLFVAWQMTTKDWNDVKQQVTSSSRGFLAPSNNEMTEKAVQPSSQRLHSLRLPITLMPSRWRVVLWPRAMCNNAPF